LEKKYYEKNLIKIFQIADFKNLHEIVRQGKTVAIVGGGFLGSELACALASASKRVNYLISILIYD
jgi:programmed cell death 8 (apoptosis-inducing factor)